jgi:hypothetical protein
VFSLEVTNGLFTSVFDSCVLLVIFPTESLLIAVCASLALAETANTDEITKATVDDLKIIYASYFY